MPVHIRHNSQIFKIILFVDLFGLVCERKKMKMSVKEKLRLWSVIHLEERECQ